MLIKGTALSQRQRAMVLQAYVHRHLAIGEGKHYPTEDAWVVDHSFHFVKNGSRLAANRTHAEPHWMADHV
jgi:hypothetical protein